MQELLLRRVAEDVEIDVANAVLEDERPADGTAGLGIVFAEQSLIAMLVLPVAGAILQEVIERRCRTERTTDGVAPVSPFRF